MLLCRIERRDDDNAALEFILREQSIQTDDSETWRFNGKHFEVTADLDIGQRLRRILTENGWSDRTGLAATIQNGRTAVKEMTYSPMPVVAQEPKAILNFQNGELHFLDDQSIELRPHSPSSGLTHVLDINYEPDAIAPIFQQTLEELFWPPARERLKHRTELDQQAYEDGYRAHGALMREYVEELLAYLIVPKRWIAAWFIWVGEGHNGKTFLTNILSLILDMKAIESDRLQAFTETFGMERLIGKTLVIDDDLDTNTTIPDGFVKKVSEAKYLSANRKNKTSLTFMNRSALLLLANNYPRLIDVSSGTRRRIHALEFPRHFHSPEEIDALASEEARHYAKFDMADPSLIAKIEAELPGVVIVLTKAYQRLRQRGGFTLPDAVKSTNEKVLLQGNPLPMFLKIQCEKGPAYSIKTSKFAEELREWLRSQHLDWKPSNHQIRSLMRNLGWTDDNIFKINGDEHYAGLNTIGLEPADERGNAQFDNVGPSFLDDVDLLLDEKLSGEDDLFAQHFV